MCVLVVGNREPITEIHHTGPRPSALAMLCRQTSLMPLPDGSLHVMDETVSHVVDWVGGPLPDELFELPAGYTQVEVFQ
jgi:hypothetical protein